MEITLLIMEDHGIVLLNFCGCLEINYLTFCKLEIPEQIVWQTVELDEVRSRMRHFIGVCTVC